MQAPPCVELSNDMKFNTLADNVLLLFGQPVQPKNLMIYKRISDIAANCNHDIFYIQDTQLCPIVTLQCIIQPLIVRVSY